MTNKAKHTPGPWYKAGDRYVEDQGDLAVIHSGAKDWPYAVAYVMNREDEPLIAAAPELLAAVEESQEVLRLCLGWDKDLTHKVTSRFQANRAAIAKAKGG